MTDALEPTTETASADAGAVATADAAPRLPDAEPAATPAPTTTPEPQIDEATADPDAPTTNEKSRAPVGFFVLILLILGAIAAIGAVARPWESPTEDPAPVVEEQPTATTPAATPATAPLTTAPASTAPASTTPSTTPASTATTTTAVVVTLP